MTGNLHVQALADKAATEFLKNKVPLNDSIKKMAELERLNPESIARVVERANTGVQTSLFASHGPKEVFEFPLASAKEVLASLNMPIENYEEKPKTEQPEKAASMEKLARWSGDLVGSDWNPNNMTPDQLMVRTKEVFSQAETEIKGMVIESEGILEKRASEFVEGCRQLLAAGDFTHTELAENIYYLRPAVSGLANSLIKEASDLTHHTRPVDAAEDFSETPPAYITDGKSRPVKVIDSNHGVIMALDTLVNQARSTDQIQKGYGVINDKVRYVQHVISDHLSREYEKEIR